MPFALNSNQSLHGLDEIYACVKAWSNEIPEEFQLIRKTNSVFLTIVNEKSSFTVNVKEAKADHTYERKSCSDGFGFSEVTKLYKLTLKGKDIEGNHFVFKASLKKVSEDSGRTWAPPFAHANFAWQSSL